MSSTVVQIAGNRIAAISERLGKFVSIRLVQLEGDSDDGHVGGFYPAGSNVVVERTGIVSQFVETLDALRRLDPLERL